MKIKMISVRIKKINLYLCYLIFLSMNLLASDNTSYISCKESETSNPPFYISDEYKQGDKVWENLRSLDNPSKKVEGYLPRGSIVRVDMSLTEKDDNFRYPVVVTSIQEKKVEKELKVKNIVTKYFNNISKVPGKLKRAKVGDVGYLSKKALKQAGEYVFVVKKDSVLHKEPNLNNLGKSPLILKRKKNNYVGKYCCLHEFRGDQNPSCHFRYTFLALKDKKIIKEIDVDKCSISKSVIAIPNINGLASPILDILDEMYTEFPGYDVEKGISNSSAKISGLRLLPAFVNSKTQKVERAAMIKFPIDSETFEGPFNSFHYNEDDSSSNDAYLRPASMCAFMKVLKKFEKKCGKSIGCEVQFGDLYHQKSWKQHSTHGSGTCIDLRPLKKDSYKKLSRAGLTHNSKNFDRKRTQDFIDIAIGAGASPIYFNDSNILKKTRKNLSSVPKKNRPIVSKMKGHDNHLHICFDPKKKKVQKACSAVED